MHSSVHDQQSLLRSLVSPPTERRARVRYRCVRHCTTRTFITNTYRSLPARLVDVSTEGAGLILAEPLPIGTRLTVELEDADPAVELLVDVANVTAQPDGSWRCGCVLVWRISEQEMWLLLKGEK